MCLFLLLFHTLLKCFRHFFFQQNLTHSTPVGRIINYFSRDFHLIDFWIPSQIEQIVGQTCTIIGMLIIIGMANWVLLLLLVVSVVFVLFHTTFIPSTIELHRLEGLLRSLVFIH